MDWTAFWMIGLVVALLGVCALHCIWRMPNDPAQHKV